MPSDAALIAAFEKLSTEEREALLAAAKRPGPVGFSAKVQQAESKLGWVITAGLLTPLGLQMAKAVEWAKLAPKDAAAGG